MPSKQAQTHDPKSIEKKPARKRAARKKKAAPQHGYLTRLGAYGFEKQESGLLAALAVPCTATCGTTVPAYMVASPWSMKAA